MALPDLFLSQGGPPDRAAGTAGGGHGLARKLQSGDFPLPYRKGLSPARWTCNHT